MKTFFRQLTVTAVLLLTGSISMAQQPKFPVVLTQKFPSAIKSIVVSGSFNINVVQDTANYIDIITTATADEIDTLRFPKGKLRLTNDGTQLNFNPDFPYRLNIRVHTTAASLNLLADDDAQITLSKESGGKVVLNDLTLTSQGQSRIVISDTVNTKEVNLAMKDYGEIRYGHINSPRVNRHFQGAGRLVAPGKKSESSFSFFYRNHIEYPIFFEYSFGSSTMAKTPFGGFNSPTGNFIWSVKPLGHFNFTARYAFWQNEHWDISAGFGAKVYTAQVDNAYLEIVNDPSTGLNSLTATNSHALFAQEENLYGPILWNSSFGFGQYHIPIRISWRNRSDYKGIGFSCELQPGITVSKRTSFLYRKGTYQDINQVASTRDEELGNYINPFTLGIKLSASMNKVAVYVESSLTPLFRTKQQEDKLALNQKIYPFSIGISLNY